VEVNAKTIYFYLSDNSIMKVNGSLADFEPTLLKRTEFIKVHRSYIANLVWVQKIGQNELLTVCGRRVPIARAVYSQTKTAYTKFLFKEADELDIKGGE
jgi:DNA-binding LytR/AlgR family response regulator